MTAPIIQDEWAGLLVGDVAVMVRKVTPGQLWERLAEQELVLTSRLGAAFLSARLRMEAR